MTRFCAIMHPDQPDHDLQRVGGQLVYHDAACAMGTLSDAQPHIAAGPYVVRRQPDGLQLVGIGQVTLFNRAALLTDLARSGHHLPADCADGELLLHIYAQAGYDGLARLRGMVALAIWDGTDLTLVRDPVGMRTLFYTQAEGGWMAASALRALRRWPRLAARVNLAAVRTYLTFAYLPGTETLLEGVYEVLPGQCVQLRLSAAPTTSTYWPIREQPCHPDDPPHIYRDHLRQLLENAVQDCLPPQQPVAVFLSGGIDSSLVTALAARLHDQPVTTYALNFGADLPNELAYAGLVAAHCGTCHHVLTYDGPQVLRHLVEAMGYLDCPVGDPLTAPNLLMARQAAADGFRVTLNGEGGDPCFGGPKNLPMLLFELQHPHADPYERARAYLQSYRKCYEDLPTLLQPSVQDALRSAPPLEALIQPYLESPVMSTYLNRLLLTNVRTKGAHHILSKVQALTSACGIEGRSPLFDPTIVAYSFAIPARFKLAGTSEKWILKQAAHDLLPPTIITRPKSGMQTPVQAWWRGALGDLVTTVLLDPQAQTRDILRPDTIQAWLHGKHSLWPRYGPKLWLTLTLELWLRAYLADDTFLIAPHFKPRRWWRLFPHSFPVQSAQRSHPQGGRECGSFLTPEGNALHQARKLCLTCCEPGCRPDALDAPATSHQHLRP